MVQSVQLETLIKKLNSLEKKLDEQNVLNKDILDLQEASSYLNISESLLYKLVHRKAIVFYKPARKLFFRKEDLNDWVLSKKQNDITHESLELARQEVRRFINQL